MSSTQTGKTRQDKLKADLLGGWDIDMLAVKLAFRDDPDFLALASGFSHYQLVDAAKNAKQAAESAKRATSDADRFHKIDLKLRKYRGQAERKLIELIELIERAAARKPSRPTSQRNRKSLPRRRDGRVGLVGKPAVKKRA